MKVLSFLNKSIQLNNFKKIILNKTKNLQCREDL
jgi:hypothetical protein